MCYAHLPSTQHIDVSQGVARVLSKLPNLQSMTQRLRSHSQRVLQPVAQQHYDHPATVDEADEDQKPLPLVSDTEAHVVVFVHGFRVGSVHNMDLHYW